MILVLGALVLLAAAGTAAAAVFGITAPFALPIEGPGGPLNGWLIVTLGALLIAFAGAFRLPRGQRFLSLLSLDAAVLLCVVALVWGPKLSAVQPEILSASNRFWTLFDLVMYSVIALVLMNAGLFSRGGRRRDDDEDDPRR